MKETANKNKRFLICFIAIVTIVLTGCGSVKNENKLESAEIYNYSEISKVAKDNAARATEFNDKYFVMYGTITNIAIDNLTLSNDTSGEIQVFLETEILKELDKDTQISVLGKISNAIDSPAIMNDAKVLTQEELESYFIIDLTRENGTKYPNCSYSNYKYDSACNAIEYEVRGDYNGTCMLTYDENSNLTEKALQKIIYGKDVNVYEYDDNGNIILEEEISYDEEGKEKTKKIFDVLIEKDSNGNIVKKSSINRDAPDFSYEWTYEYNG